MCLETKKCVSAYHRELICSICLGILCIDCLMDDAEHVFCKSCIFEWLRLGNSTCPIGKEPINKDNLKGSRFIKSILSDLQVHCKYEEEGCTLIIRYEELIKHENECKFNLTTCACGMTMQNIELKNHKCRLEIEKELKRQKEKLDAEELAKKKETSWKFDTSRNSYNAFKKEYEALLKQTNKVTYDNLDSKSKLALIETCSPFYEYEVVKSAKSFHVPSKSLFTMVYLRGKRKIVISDYMDRSLKILDLNGAYQDEVSQIGFLDKPWALCSNSRNDLFISDWEKRGIVKMDANLKPIGQLGEKTIRNACYMAIDTDNDTFLYITHYIDNKVTVWNLIENKQTNSFDIDTPEYIQIKRNKIYLTSRSEIEYVEGRKEFKRIKDGSNCIFVVNKSTCTVLHAIRLAEWLDPRGLHVDENYNILTTAFKIEGEENNRSDFRYLYILNERKNSFSTICLNGVEVLSDMLMIDNRLYICISDMIEIITLK